MSQHEMIPFRRIIEMVREFCTQRRTGTVFIVSDDNRMAQVHLESGNIVALLCRGLSTGRKRWPKHAHHAGGPPALRRQLPDRQRCRALRHQCRARPAGRRRGGRSRAAERAAPAPPPRRPHLRRRARSLRSPGGRARTDPGPVRRADGGNPVRRPRGAGGQSASALIAVLADEIPDKAQASRFAREAGRLLGLH
ncbi:hypothetical protein LP419_34840 [Massilia sp. H-1]|nr:hypothetical protein LP419_34840 [Massilia sp. H-1]